MIIFVNRIILIPIILFLYSFNTYAFNNSDWQQCPQPFDSTEMTLLMAETFGINSKKELINFISTMVHAFEPSPIPKDEGNSTVPIRMKPNENCDGVITTFVLSNTSDLNEMELSAWRGFYDGDFGFYTQAENFCTGKIMYWMRDYGYTTRSIVVTENDELITDTTYDYDLCAEFIRIHQNS